MPAYRDVLYIHLDTSHNVFMCHGIEFREFIESLKEPIHHILLLKHQFSDSEYHEKTRLDFVRFENINRLLKDNIYQYGNFCWLDFQNVNTLETLTSKEISEILYFCHMGIPLDTPFNQKLQNRFAYYSHDDGWFNRIYCKNTTEFIEILNHCVTARLAKLIKIKADPLSRKISNELFKLFETGVLLNFRKMHKHLPVIAIHTIGKHYDMDDIINHLEKYIDSSVNHLNLQYNTSSWQLADSASE